MDGGGGEGGENGGLGGGRGGGDWGGMVTSVIGAQNLGHCAGIHVNLVVVGPPSEEMMTNPTPAEQAPLQLVDLGSPAATDGDLLIQTDQRSIARVRERLPKHHRPRALRRLPPGDACG